MKNNYSRVEGMLYSYYRKKDRIARLKSKEVRIQNRIDRLRKDIKECNIELDATIQAIDYSKDAVQSNSVASSIEKELENAVDRMLKDIAYNIREKRENKEKIRGLERSIEDIEILLEDLTEEEKQILELRYSEKMSDKLIGDMINMSRTTIQRRRTELIEELGEEMSIKWAEIGQKSGN